MEYDELINEIRAIVAKVIAEEEVEFDTDFDKGVFIRKIASDIAPLLL